MIVILNGSFTVAGNIDQLRALAEQTSRRWIKGMGCAFRIATH